MDLEGTQIGRRAFSHNFDFVNEVNQFNIEDMLPYGRTVYRLQVAMKYTKILAVLLFLIIGLALFSIRRIRIMRAVGTMKSDENFRVLVRKVNSLNLDFNSQDTRVIPDDPDDKPNLNRRAEKDDNYFK
jgi:hypothetical protein